MDNSDIDQLVKQIETKTSTVSNSSAAKKKKNKKKKPKSDDKSQDDSNNEPKSIPKNKKGKRVAPAILKQLKEKQQRLAEERQKEEEFRLELETKQKEEEELYTKKLEESERIRKEKNERQREKQKKNKKDKERQEALFRLGINIDDIKSNTEGNRKVNYGKKKNKKKPNKKIQETKPVQETVIQENIADSWEDILDESNEEFKLKEEEVKLKEDIQIESKPIETIQDNNIERVKEPICCILGNVDAGKTTFVDEIRSTNVQKNEAGGITQTINTVYVAFKENKFKIPGIILIDTPGHDSFYNLRSFGASLCNFVILMVDITEGLKEQTLKSIELIKKNKIPFVVALNKLDRITMWNSDKSITVSKNLKTQDHNSISHFESLVANVNLQFAEAGLNTELHFRNSDPKTYASMFPISAVTGEGISELFAGLMKLLSTYMKKEIIWHNTFKGVLTDVNIQKGLGRSLTILMYDGMITKKDTVVFTGINGPVIKQISKIGVSSDKNFNLMNEAYATKQLEIVPKSNNDETYIIGSPVYVLPYNLSKKDMDDEINKSSELIQKYINSKQEELRKNTSRHGIIVCASSFGGLSAITEYLDNEHIPYIDAKIGTIKKQDINKVLNFNTTPETHMYNTIVCFSCQPDKRALDELKENPQVTLIQEDIIYRIFDKLKETILSKKDDIRSRYEKMVSYPAVMEIMPEHIITKRDPIILGIKVKAGKLKKNSVIQCLKKNKKTLKSQDDIIVLGSIINIKNPKGIDVSEAKEGEEVSIEIKHDVIGQSPKMVGRDFNIETELWTQITSESHYIMQKYFYEDMEPSGKDAFHKLSQNYGFERKLINESDSENDYW
jgi:translation initiation factor 5B